MTVKKNFVPRAANARKSVEGGSEPAPPENQLTASIVAETIKAVMPTIVDQAGQRMAETIKDTWEESLEKTAKAQEEQAREARKASLKPTGFQEQLTAKQVEERTSKNAQTDLGSLYKASMVAQLKQIPLTEALKQDKTLGDDRRKSLIERVQKAGEIMQAGNYENAGILIPEDTAREIIPLLESQTVFLRRATTAPVPRGSLKLHKQNMRIQASWTDESEDLAITGQQFSELKLTPKKLRAGGAYSQEMLMYGGPLAANVITRDITTALSQRLDESLFRGTGTEYQPRGLRDWTRNANKLAAPIATFDNNIQNMLATLVRAKVALLNEDLPGITPTSTTWYLNPDLWGSFYRAHDPNSGISVFQAELSQGRLLGHEIDISTANPANLIDEGEPGVDKSDLTLIYWPGIVVGMGPGMSIESSNVASYRNPVTGDLVSAWSQDEIVTKGAIYADMVARYDFCAHYTRVPSNYTGEKAP